MFKPQSKAKEALTGAWRPAGEEDTTMMCLRKYMNEQERVKLNEHRARVHDLNEKILEEENRKFFRQVMSMKVRKWFID